MRIVVKKNKTKGKSKYRPKDSRQENCLKGSGSLIVQSKRCLVQRLESKKIFTNEKTKHKRNTRFENTNKIDDLPHMKENSCEKVRITKEKKMKVLAKSENDKSVRKN